MSFPNGMKSQDWTGQMAKEWVIRGVPRALTVDMWWLASMTDRPADPPPRRIVWQGDGAGRRATALAVLVALADLLFYCHAVGLSLALFAGAVLAAVITLTSGQERLRPALLLVAAALPVIDYVQALSLAFLAVGLLVSLVWATGGMEAIGRRTLRLMGDLPLRGVHDGIHLGADLARGDLLRDHRRHLKSWAFPLGGALILIGLLVEANPVLDDLFSRLLNLQFGSEIIGRLLFWIGAALIIWPLIAPAKPVHDQMRSIDLPLPGPGSGSVARGLVLFNAILAVQTAMDAAYLWGGATLPPGMTPAEYAHRGAYPLLVTALLAGAFALTARPFAREDRRLRMLLMLWLGQNVALTVSALMRLELYVEAFGLTYLRVHAAIWMVLVALGLGLTAWQVWRDRPNRWLLVRSVALGVATLYGASFVNFAAIIAAENLSRERFDGTYVCSLGPMAAAAIAASGRSFVTYSDEDYEYRPCMVDPPQIEGWRDWGFRNWRVSRYLEAVPTTEAVGEDTRRG
jgi:Domain of unknown function (DUF4173)